MVRINIQKCQIGDEKKLCFVEFQGWLEPRQLPEDFQPSAMLSMENYKNHYIGDIYWLKAQDRPLLICGHHSVQGEVKHLKQPMALMEKLPNSGPETGEYRVTAIINHKIVFNKRPQPIVIEVKAKPK